MGGQYISAVISKEAKLFFSVLFTGTCLPHAAAMDTTQACAASATRVHESTQNVETFLRATLLSRAYPCPPARDFPQKSRTRVFISLFSIKARRKCFPTRLNATLPYRFRVLRYRRRSGGEWPAGRREGGDRQNRGANLSQRSLS